MSYTHLAAMIFCATFFARGARLEQRSPVLWGFLSVGSWILGGAFFGGGLVASLIGQVVLFFALTLIALHRAGELPGLRR